MKEFSLLRDIDRTYIELWEQCKNDPNCSGIVAIKGRRQPDNHFANMVYMIQRNLLEGEIVVVIGTNEKYIDAIKEALENFYQIKPLVDPQKNPEGNCVYSWKLTLLNIKYEKGKLYSSATTTIMCTGPGLSPTSFAGVVVEQLDPMSDFQVGLFSPQWNGYKDHFKESSKPITIDPAKWKEFSEIPNSPGN